MKCPSIVLSLGFVASCACTHAQQPTVPPATPAPAVTAPAVPTPSGTVLPATQPDAAPAPGQTSESQSGAPGASSAQPAPPAPLESADVAPDYVLGPEDAISVNVWKEPSLSGSLAIRPDGKISLPLLGDVTAAGLKPMDLAASIADQLKKFVNDPTVTVTVTAVNSKRIFFVGQVGHQGAVPMTRQFSMLQAISAAGGLGPFAAGKKIYILRTVNGKQQKIFYNYNKALKTGDEQGVKLYPGDTIVVP